MANNGNQEIEIPQPINRPKETQTEKVNHPEQPSKLSVKTKPSSGGPKGPSRFEPQAIPVEVPSHGYLYRGLTDDKDVTKGIVKIRPLTLAEEKILTTDRFVQQGVALDMVLENCIKSDVDPVELLSSDRVYLLFYLRGMSYGLDYTFDVKCYHCGHNFQQEVQIDQLPVTEWGSKEDAQEPIEGVFPMSGAAFKARFMRGKDEQELVAKERELRNFSEADSGASDSLLLLIDEITLSDGETLGPADKEDFINHMVAGDTDYFREVLRERSCGIQPMDHIYCPRCQGELEFNVPLGRNFFRRSRQR